MKKRLRMLTVIWRRRVDADVSESDKNRFNNGNVYQSNDVWKTRTLLELCSDTRLLLVDHSEHDTRVSE